LLPLPTTITLSEAILVVALFSGISVLQFFRGRRINLELMRHSVRVLERVLSPRDKNYTLVGLYVGYKAVLWLDRGPLNRAEVTVLFLPRYSAFYYPISKLVTRFDRVYLTYWYSRYLGEELHLVKHGAYRRSPRKIIKGFDSMQQRELEIDGHKFVAVYRSERHLGKLVKFVRDVGADIVNHVAIVPENRSLYIYAKLDPLRFERFVEKSYELARSLA